MLLMRNEILARFRELIHKDFRIVVSEDESREASIAGSSECDGDEGSSGAVTGIQGGRISASRDCLSHRNLEARVSYRLPLNSVRLNAPLYLSFQLLDLRCVLSVLGVRP